jgi:hypothetical protein
MKKMQQCIATIALLSMLSACNNDKPSSDGVFTKINKNEGSSIKSKKHNKTIVDLKSSQEEQTNKEVIIISKKNDKVNTIQKQTPSQQNIVKITSNKIEEQTVKTNINSNFNIQIDKDDIELVKIISILETQYNKEKQNALEFYTKKMTELDNNFIKQLDDAKNNLNTVSSKFNSKCKIFTTSNIEQCNKMKNIIDDSTNIVAKGDFEIKNILSSMKKNKHKELTSLEVEFQKSVLDAKNEYIFSKD